MKKTILSFMCVASLLAAAISCTKKGEVGPVGATGSTGTTGSQGPTGNANVSNISATALPTYWSMSNGNTLALFKLYDTFITQSILDSGAILVYGDDSMNSTELLPITLGKTIIAAEASVGFINIYMYNTDGSTLNITKTYYFRTVVIPVSKL